MERAESTSAVHLKCSSVGDEPSMQYGIGGLVVVAASVWSFFVSDLLEVLNETITRQARLSIDKPARQTTVSRASSVSVLVIYTRQTLYFFY